MAEMRVLASAFLALTLTSSAALGQVCFQDGTCNGGSFLDFDANPTSPEECLQLCFDRQPECQWWTYAAPPAGQAFHECFLYSTCGSTGSFPEQGNCVTECTSGEASCAELDVCAAKGACSAPAGIFETNVPSAEACLQDCKEAQGGAEGQRCNYYTYTVPDVAGPAGEGTCLLYNECDLDNLTPCDDCVTGQVECNNGVIGVDNFKRMMVTTGFETPSSRIVDVLAVNDLGEWDSLSDDGCRNQVQQFPLSINGAGGGWARDRPVICGGILDDFQALDNCYEYNVAGRIWTSSSLRLETPRYDVATVKIDENQFWMSGGVTNGASALDSSEIYDANLDAFRPGPVLPRATSDHCVTQIDRNRYLFALGFPLSSFVYIYDFEEDEWTRVSDFPDQRRGAFCGRVVRANGDTEIVVSAGFAQSGAFAATTFIYSVDRNRWEPGPAYPMASVTHGATVQYRDSFFAVGGNNALGSVYYFPPDRNEWMLVDRVLAANYYFTVGLMVPYDFFECNDPPATTVRPSTAVVKTHDEEDEEED